MALDQPPMNRAQRRAAAHSKKNPTLVLPQRAPRQPSRSRSAAPAPAIPTGAPSSAEEDDMAEAQDAPPFAAFMSGGDSAPARKSASHHKGGSKQTRIYEGLVSYYAFAGMLIAARNPADGMLIAGEAERLAGLWLEAGKSSPPIMRALELITVAGPYTALVFAHGQIALALMNNHGVSPFSLFSRADSTPDTLVPPDGQTGRGAAPAPLPYQPVGPSAPTDTGMPLTMPPIEEEGLRVYPDVELPSDLDVALRQAARKSGRPYQELADEARLQIAQLRMSQNGHVQAPGALGAPIARE